MIDNQRGVIKTAVLDFFFPEYLSCLACGKELEKESQVQRTDSEHNDLFDPTHKGHVVFCQSCLDRIHFQGEKVCSKCGKTIEHEYSGYKVYRYKCKACQENFHYFDRHISVTAYEELAKKMVLDLKYNEKTFYAKVMGEWMARAIPEDFKPDYIVPVPIHITRRMTRGFNQAELLALEIAKHCQVGHYEKLLIRQKYTQRLKKLGKADRKLSLNRAIVLKNVKKHEIMGKNILLIDDIFTTGTTLDACAKVLYESGANSIYGLTFTAKNDANDKEWSVEDDGRKN